MCKKGLIVVISKKCFRLWTHFRCTSLIIIRPKKENNAKLSRKSWVRVCFLTKLKQILYSTTGYRWASSPSSSLLVFQYEIANCDFVKRTGRPGNAFKFLSYFWNALGGWIIKIWYNLCILCSARLRLRIAYFRACAGIGYTFKSSAIELVDSKIPFPSLNCK